MSDSFDIHPGRAAAVAGSGLEVASMLPYLVATGTIADQTHGCPQPCWCWRGTAW
ncbi:hypothetical protein GS454_02870 [Rhodococcus hoagii]|nr:hypothetical protein [Prescottella equi]